MERTVTIALIGTGTMGRQYAQMIHRGAVPHMRLTAVCCRSEEALRWARETLGGQTAIYRSAEELYGHPKEYDSVLIVTPHCSHRELAEQAFALGKHVFCDKPSGLSVYEARKMKEAARSCGRKFAIMFHQRLYAKNRRIREVIENGELGEIRRIAMKNTEPYRTFAYHSSGSWHSTWGGEGGGALINQGQHLLDLWQWFFGMPREVYAAIPFGKYNEFAVDDEAEILMKYDNGVTGSFFLSTGEARSEERLEVVGSRATLVVEGESVTVCRYSQDLKEYGRKSQYRTRQGLELTQETGIYPTKKEYEQMLENFALAVLEGKELIAPGEEGYKALELANSAYLSAWLGKPVSLPLNADQYEAELRKRMEEEKRAGDRRAGEDREPAQSGNMKEVSGHGSVRMTTLCHLERDGKYLMLHRISKKVDENKDKWIGVGGHVGEGESPEDCLIREVREETGLTLTSYQFRGLVTFVSDEWGTEYMCLYTAKEWTGEMTECTEGTLEWVDKDQICSLNIWEGDKIFFRLLKEEAPFFSLKVRYEGDCLKEAVLDGKTLETFQ